MTWRWALLALFVVYLLLLTWIVLWKLQPPWIGGVDRVIKLVPFVAFGGLGASRAAEVAANVLLFVPLGGYLRLLAPARARLARSALVAAGTSVAFEATQYVLAIGSSDITDVIANTGGALIGYALAALVGRRLAIRICALGTAAAVLACAAFLASAPPAAPDRGPLSGAVAIEGSE